MGSERSKIESKRQDLHLACKVADCHLQTQILTPSCCSDIQAETDILHNRIAKKKKNLLTCLENKYFRVQFTAETLQWKQQV